MSLTYQQTINQIEKECGFNKGDIWNNAVRKAEFTEDINLAQSDAMTIMLLAQGSWKIDDKTHTDYTILTTDMIQGQSDYSFNTDEQENLILDVYEVYRKEGTGYTKLDAVDLTEDFWDTTQGTPTKWAKLSNAVFVSPSPKEYIAGGLQFWVSRESIEFTTADTTKMSGIDGRFHEWNVLVPSYKYSRRNGLSNVARLERDIQLMEARMKEVMQARQSPVASGLRPNIENNK